MVISDRKRALAEKLSDLLDNYRKILIVGADHVGSTQLQRIRQSLRGKAVVLMGKKTIVRKLFKDNMEQYPYLEALLPRVHGNVGFVFVKDDIQEVRKVVLANRVGAPAKAGSISPVEVVVPVGNTGLEPTKTSFFQALNISTKISKGAVEITTPHVLLKPGEKVGTSEAQLLQMLHINPFSYGLTIEAVCDDGVLYTPEVLELQDSDFEGFFKTGVANLQGLSMQTGVMTELTAPSFVMNGFRNLLALAFATSYSFPQADALRQAMESASAAPAAPVEAKVEVKEKPQQEEPKKPKEKPKEEEEDDMPTLDLFG